MNGVPNGAGWPEPPKVPELAFEYLNYLMKMADLVTGVPPYPLKFIEHKSVPKGEIWLVDQLGMVIKIVNIANYLDDNSAISLCVGEMK